MITGVYKKNIDDVYKTPIVQQTAFWSEVKRKSGLKTAAIDFKVMKNDIGPDPDDNSNVNGDVLVVIRRIDNNNSIAYVPYGPEIEPEEQKQGVFLEELAEILRSFLPKNCIMVRFDLAWESYWASEPDFSLLKADGWGHLKLQFRRLDSTSARSTGISEKHFLTYCLQIPFLLILRKAMMIF